MCEGNCKCKGKGKCGTEEVVVPKNRCYFCGSEMIWGGDNSFEDFDYVGEGLVVNLSCSNSDCEATAEFVTRMNE